MAIPGWTRTSELDPAAWDLLSATAIGLASGDNSERSRKPNSIEAGESAQRLPLWANHDQHTVQLK